MAISDELRAQSLRYHFVEHWRVGTIASQLGVHHSTVERVLGEAGVQRERQRRRRASKLDPYRAFITETLERFPTLTAARLFNMVKARGYTGGPDHFRHSVVSRYVSWNPHGNSPVCFVDELPGMTKQSERRSRVRITHGCTLCTDSTLAGLAKQHGATAMARGCKAR